MTRIERKGAHLTDEQRTEALKEIVYFFEKERDEEIGVIAAEQVLNFFLASVGPMLYNKGIQDSKKAIQNRFDELNYDLDDMIDL